MLNLSLQSLYKHFKLNYYGWPCGACAGTHYGEVLLHRTSRAGCLVPVSPCFKITLGHTRLDGQHFSCSSSAGRCLIIHPIVWTSPPVISTFSYTSRNSSPVSISVFRMTERRRWVSHSGSNPRRQTSTTQGYKTWSNDMTNVPIADVNMLIMAQHLLYLFQWIFTLN